MSGVREEEAAECDAGPEAGGDVADMGGGGVAVGDEEGDDPAGDGDFGALVAEDEEGAEDGGFVAEGRFEELGPGGGRVGVRGGGVEEVDGGVVLFVVAVGEECEEEVGEGEGEGDEVESAPGSAVVDQTRGYNGGNGSSDPIAAVQTSQSCGGIGEVGAEDVIGRKVRCYA